ncbi:SGNH/GDSL hydrolase family protein [Enterococcus casseliflavus]|uniref:SGNH/GDSL hydrolase family protein n=1 Tax=Enterococcus casseliflavus TaxID=37734 RepID=UPI0029555568|nr:SGNH/GDSL hydrolase family protein [Enterococcus casseliflavus]MDV7752657.1 SGNH/GDSL hydrolase family protein [Enterococcus casseliflavus]
MELDQFKNIDLVIDKANSSFIQKQFVSQGDYKGRTLTVQVTNNGVVGEVAGLTLNLQWHNKASGLTDLSAFSVVDKTNSIFRIEYPQNMMTPGEVVASIQVLQGGKSTFLKSFTMTVQQLAGEAVSIAQKAEFSALVAVLADSNKFRTDISSLGMSKVDKGGNEQVTLPMLSQEVKTAMTGGSVAVVGKDAVNTTNVVDGAVTIQKTNFFTPDFVNLVDTYIADEYYNITDGKILKKGETGYQANWGRTKLTAVNDGDVIYRNGKVGNTDTGPVYITFFADSSASQFISGSTWTITDQLSTFSVPVGAKYFSMSIRDTAKANGGEVSVNVSPGYKNTKQSLEIGNFSNIPYTYDKGWLVSVPRSEDILTIDYEKKELRVKAIPCFATWGSNYKWIYGGGGISLPTQGFAYTFDEIQAAIGGVSEGQYIYMFVRRDQGTVYSAKDMFSFYSYNYMKDRGGPYYHYRPFREQIIKSHVFIGMFALASTAYSFPGTPVSVVTTKAVDAITKKISFLGDSITTYAGYIPTGNVAFYPSSGAIKDVNLTWWKKLIDKSSGKLELLVNNSWSGSRVTTTGGTDSSGITRAELLDNQTDSPDIIIVYMGVNDFNNNVPIGTFDGSSALPNVTTTFGEAYGILLNKVVNKYPTAKVYCATIPINSRGPYPRTNANGDTLASYNDRIRKIGESFGADILDFARAGFNHVSAANFTSDGLHPNESGMTIMYDKARKALGLY